MAVASSVPETLGSGRYEVRSSLGEGGMAAVYRVFDTLLGADRAVKLLSEELSENQSARKRFEREARTMARLSHPNILAVLDVGEDRGRPWFVMELLEGGNAMDWLRDKGAAADLEALRITFEVLQALAAAHLLGVVHRDVKPDNVLVTRDGVSKLSDFGIAHVPDRNHRTRTGMTMGTLGYMAPEQRDDAKRVDGRADVFSAGATLMALVTRGHPPELFASDLFDVEALAALPSPIARIVRRATRYKAEDRYATAREMARDVALARDELAGLRILPLEAARWMARFDELIETRAAFLLDSGSATPTFGIDDVTATPAGGTGRATLRESLPPAPEIAEAGSADEGTPGRLVVAGMLGLVAVAVLFAGGLWWMTLAGDSGPCVGTWSSGDGIRMELAPAGASRVQGRVELPGLAGSTRRSVVRGRCPRLGGTLRLVEEDALDAGTWAVTLEEGSLEGTLSPAGGVARPVVLRRETP